MLAVLPESREVLGIAHQEPFLRQAAPEEETKRQRLLRARESQVWERSVQALGAPPAGVQWIHIGDRYGDMFPFLTLCREQHCDFVVRAAQDRHVDLLVEQAEASVPKRSHRRRSPEQQAASKPQHLFEVVRAWSAVGKQELDLPATKQRRARQAQVVISYGVLRLLPPEDLQASHRHPRARLGRAGVGTAATRGHRATGMGAAHLDAHPDG